MFEYKVTGKWKQLRNQKSFYNNKKFRNMMKSIHELCIEKGGENNGALKSFLVDERYYVNYNSWVCTIADTKIRNASVVILKKKYKPVLLLVHPKCSLVNKYGNLSSHQFDVWYNNINNSIHGNWLPCNIVNFYMDIVDVLTNENIQLQYISEESA